VGKQVITAAILDNKAVSFGIIEPLDLSFRHFELRCSGAVETEVLQASFVIGVQSARECVV